MKRYVSGIMTFCLGLIINTIAFTQNNTTAKTETEKEKAKPEKPFAYVSFSGGVSMPVLIWQKYVTTGALNRIRIGIPIGRKGHGINISTNTTYNPFNAQAYAEALSSDPVFRDKWIKTRATPYIASAVSFGYFRTGNFRKGFFGKGDPISWLHVDSWLNFCLLTATTPQIKISFDNSSQFILGSDVALGYGGEFGTAWRFDVSQRIALMFELDAFIRLANFNDNFKYLHRVNFSLGIALPIGCN